MRSIKRTNEIRQRLSIIRLLECFLKERALHEGNIVRIALYLLRQIGQLLDHFDLSEQTVQHGLADSAAIRLQDQAEPMLVPRALHLALDVPEEVEADALRAERAAKKQASQRVVVVGLVLQALQEL